MKEKSNKPQATAKQQQMIDAINEKINQFNTLTATRPFTDEEENAYIALQNEKEAILNEYDWFDQPFVENGRYGIRDVFGNIVIPANFDDYVELFHYDYRRSAIPMTLDGKTVLVKTDGTGDILPDTAYDTIRYVPYTSLYCMWRDGKFGFMTTDGNVYIDCICDEYCEPLNGLIMYRSGSKWGIFDEYGNIALPVFDEIVDPEPQEFVKVRLGNQVGYINDANEFTTDDAEAAWSFDCNDIW